MVVPVLVLERPFRGLVLRDLILHWRQLLLELGISGLLEVHWAPSFGADLAHVRAAGVLPPDLLQASVAPASEPVRLIADGVLAVIMLVILLGRIKLARGHDHGRDRLLEPALQRAFGLLGQSALRRVAVKDGCVVLRSEVAELTVQRQGIDVVPERAQQRFVGDLTGIVDDLNGLEVPRGTDRDLLVGRVGRAAAHVADGHRDDAIEHVERVLHGPEAPTGKGRGGIRPTGRGPAQQCYHQ